jgi:hypothetical protein
MSEGASLFRPTRVIFDQIPNQSANKGDDDCLRGMLVIGAGGWLEHHLCRPDEGRDKHDKGKAEDSEVFAQSGPAFAVGFFFAERGLEVWGQIIEVEVAQAGWRFISSDRTRLNLADMQDLG